MSCHVENVWRKKRSCTAKLPGSESILDQRLGAQCRLFGDYCCGTRLVARPCAQHEQDGKVGYWRLETVPRCCGMEARRGSHPAESWRAFEERPWRDQVRTCYRTDPCSASEGASAANSIRHSCRQIQGHRPATVPTAWRSLSWPMSWNPKFSRPEAWGYHVCWMFALSLW